MLMLQFRVRDEPGKIDSGILVLIDGAVAPLALEALLRCWRIQMFAVRADAGCILSRAYRHSDGVFRRSLL